MPSITSIATALPPYVLEQQDVKEFARALFGEAIPDIERLIGVYDNSQIERRHFCVPLEWFAEQRTFKQKNDLYIDNAIALSTEVIARCLEAEQLRHEDIDYILFVSTTGLSTPSIDAQLIQRLPFRRTVKRVPLWGLGCAGGASGLARAREIALAAPRARVLVVVVELCGLTFIRNDMSKAALIASSLFADGAAAVVVCGDELPPPYALADGALPYLIDSHTRTLDDSLDVMGWDIRDDGFHVKISRDIPTIVRTFMRESIEEFLVEHELTIADITHVIAHPGGAKVLEAYRESLGLPPEALRHTDHVLRMCGNISAASVLFVLERCLRELGDSAEHIGEYGLACALGPGFSSEQVLLRWQ